MPLYPYQERVYDLLMSGRSVILQAPTGAGKTRAALYPFLRSWEYRTPFPRKCIYAVPMRVLASQFWEEYSSLVAEYGFRNPLTVTIQTGEHRSDSKFEGDLIFATIDQVLSSFLMRPYSLPRRLSNLNAGAVAGAYLVFDEFHLFEPTSTLPTTLETLKMLKGTVPFLLMTATFSQDMLTGLAQQIGAVIVPEDEAARREMQTIPSQKKTRYYRVCEAPLDAETVLHHHKSRTLVVCNVVDRARRLFQELRAHPALGDTQVVLLHSRFLPDDRKRIETQIRTVFDRGNRSGRWIAVSTQAIEVGLNITCEALHTELAPANALLQRAGRCARYVDEVGHVFIYTQAQRDADDVIDLREHAWPYQQQREVIRRTADAFVDYGEESMSFADEQRVVTAAHGPDDRRTLMGLMALQTGHRDAMSRLMEGRRDVSASSLIRAVSSQLLLIHDDPAALIQNPFGWESFSLHPGTVRGRLAEWDAAGRLDGGSVYALSDTGDTDESGRSAYAWQPIRSAAEAYNASLLLLHPSLAGYDPELGLVLGHSTEYRSGPVASASRQRFSYAYRLETYSDHIDHVLRVFRHTIWPQVSAVAAQMASVFGWDPQALECAAYLVVVLHDVGKLGRDWQEWVRAYQASIGRPVVAGKAYAHTDFDPAIPDHTARQRDMPPRPPHAIEGATAVVPLLAAALDGCEALTKAAFTAIARHHGAFTKQGRPYTLSDEAPETIAETLCSLPEQFAQAADVGRLWMQQRPTETQVCRLIVDPGRREEILSYMLLARVLRLSDQAGTREGSGRRG